MTCRFSFNIYVDRRWQRQFLRARSAKNLHSGDLYSSFDVKRCYLRAKNVHNTQLRSLPQWKIQLLIRAIFWTPLQHSVCGRIRLITQRLHQDLTTSSAQWLWHIHSTDWPDACWTAPRVQLNNERGKLVARKWKDMISQALFWNSVTLGRVEHWKIK